jgi:hypothetical protein
MLVFKLQHYFSYRKVIVVTCFLIYSTQGTSQTLLDLSPLTITVQKDNTTGIIHLEYSNKSKRPLLVWVGDWIINYYEPNLNRYSAFKSSFVNIIYIQKTNENIQETFDYLYGDNVSNYTNLENYQLLDVNESFHVKIEATEKIVQEIEKNSHEALIVYSVVDILNLKAELAKAYPSLILQKGEEYDPLTPFRKNRNRNHYFKNIEWALPESRSLKGNSTKKTEINNDSPIKLKPLVHLQVVQQYSTQSRQNISCEILHAFSRQYSAKVRIR